MSGYKRATISITRDEYDRLRAANAVLRQVPAMSQPTADDLAAQAREALQGSMQEMERRQAHFQHLLRGFDDTLRQHERATARSLRQIQTDALRQAQQEAGVLWERVNGLLAGQEQKFLGYLAEHQRQNGEALSALSAEIQRIHNRADQMNVMAQRWLSHALAFAGFLRDNYACEFFRPAWLDNLFGQIEQARANLAEGMYETTIVAMQQLYNEMSAGRLELEQQQSTWQMLLLANWEAVQQILAHAQESQYVQAYDLEGSPLPYQIDVDYWSQGRLSYLTGKLQEFSDHLGEPVPTFGVTQLNYWRERTIPAYYAALEDIISEARVSALNSQLRVNIADLVVKALHDQGFHLENSTYESHDARMAYQARLMNLRGNEVVVQVVPTGTELGENELQLESLDQTVRTEHQLSQRWDEVQRSLSRYGLQVGRVAREASGEYAARSGGLPARAEARKARRKNPGRLHGS